MPLSVSSPSRHASVRIKSIYLYFCPYQVHLFTLLSVSSPSVHPSVHIKSVLTESITELYINVYYYIEFKETKTKAKIKNRYITIMQPGGIFSLNDLVHMFCIFNQFCYGISSMIRLFVASSSFFAERSFAKGIFYPKNLIEIRF